MEIREILIKLRNDKNLSQQQFADEIEVSRQTVARWEAGKNEPSSAQLKKISQVFDVDVNYLMTGQESKAEQEERIRYDRRTIALIVGVASVLFLAVVGLLFTIVYAVKDAVYDAVSTVLIVVLPQNTPMVVLATFIALFIAVLIFVLIFAVKGRKK